MARTAKEITTSILNNMPDSYNRSDGSVIYDLQAPVGQELAGIEETNDAILANAFFDTADDEHKEIIAKDRANITRRAATYASGTVTIEGVPGTVIEAGTQVASDYSIFDTVEEVTVGVGGGVDVEVICEDAGADGNVPAGAIYEFPTTIADLYTVTNASAMTGGYDIESIEDFAARYSAVIAQSVGAGTASDYEKWALEVDGVGAAVCFARTPSVGSVTTYIMDQGHSAASASLVTQVHDYIETKRPTPAQSIVLSVAELTVNVSLTAYVEGEASSYQTAIENAINTYITSIGFSGASRRVSAAIIADRVLGVSGVTDIDDLLLNGSADSISLASTQIAVLGGVTIAQG